MQLVQYFIPSPENCLLYVIFRLLYVLMKLPETEIITI